MNTQNDGIFSAKILYIQIPYDDFHFPLRRHTGILERKEWPDI